MNLMIVCHPDDESLFGGGSLIVEKYWKVVCVTNGNNDVRRNEFESVMSYLSHEFEIWDYFDCYDLPLDLSIKEDLKKLCAYNWDKIVTHNFEGEYGHPHHKQLHQIILDIVGKDLWEFNFSSPHLLDNEIWKEKEYLISLYKSQYDICEEHKYNTRNERILPIDRWL